MHWWVLLLCACNQFYGLEETRLPPPDAPAACPAIGGKAPVFSSVVQQALTEPTAHFHFDRSEMVVFGADGVGTISTGTRIGGPLEPSKEIESTDTLALLDPHPSPDGKRVYIRAVLDTDGPGEQVRIAMYERSGDAWVFVALIDELVNKYPSTVFSGPGGDRLLVTGFAGVEEWERVGTTWLPRGGGSLPELAPGATIGVTTDGLRAVYRGTTTMMYVDRPSVDAWFGVPQAVVGAPKVDDLQMTDDCGRIYYSGLGVVFYSRQQ